MKPHHAASFALALGLHLVLVLGVWITQALIPAAPGTGHREGGDDRYTLLLEPTPLPAPAAAPPAAASAPAGGGGQDTYFAALRRHLSRFRQPLAGDALAVQTRQAVNVHLRIRADGGLGSLRLVQSSGDPALDAEALALVRRAAPLPPPPQAMSVIVPVSVTAED